MTINTLLIIDAGELGDIDVDIEYQASKAENGHDYRDVKITAVKRGVDLSRLVELCCQYEINKHIEDTIANDWSKS